MAGLTLQLISVVIFSICWDPNDAMGHPSQVLHFSGNARSPVYHLQHFREIDVFHTCTLVVNCAGKGISASFAESCENNNPGSLTTTHFTILGNPDTNALSLYSDAPNTLVVIQEGKCTLRTYKTTDDKTSFTSDSMDSTVCETIKKKMKEEMAIAHKNMAKTIIEFHNKMAEAFPNHFKPSETTMSSEEKDPHKNNMEHNSLYLPYTSPVKTSNPEDELVLYKYRVDSPTLFISSPSTRGDPVSRHYYTISKEFNYNDNNECRDIELRLEGKGIADFFTMACSMNDLGYWSNPKKMVFGNPKFTKFSFYINAPQSLYLFIDDTCEHRQYVKTEGVTNGQRRKVEADECAKIKQEIEEELKKDNVEFDGIQIQEKKESPVVTADSDKKPQSP